METYEILKDLTIIVVFAKLFAIFAKKIKAPQVVGEIIAGILIGPSVLGLVEQTSFLGQMAEIGVVLLMFSAGLGTNLHELMKTGVKAFIIACCGVFIPLVSGALLYFAYYGMAPWGSEAFYKGVFIGVILTATSVSITVEALKELGKLKTELGQTILSAAIIDDVIGIVVLTVVIGFKDPTSDPVKVGISTILFFILSIGVGVLFYNLFKYINGRHPHARRVPIFGLGLCFGMAFIAEEYFGIADITGAYVAGVILCSLKSSDYIAEKMDISSYMLFGPIFFASIGLKTNMDSVTIPMMVFCGLFVIVGLLSKVVGCGLVSKVLGMNWSDSLKVGVGMMTRGEVALIVAQKGLNAGLLTSDYFTGVILLIVISSIATPIVMKLLFARDAAVGHVHEEYTPQA